MKLSQRLSLVPVKRILSLDITMWWSVYGVDDIIQSGVKLTLKRGKYKTSNFDVCENSKCDKVTL
jgi:hypothetical protein